MNLPFSNFYNSLRFSSIFLKVSKSRQGASTLSPSSSMTSRRKYDVFLSFRGEGTRQNFMDHLSDALKREKIFTFRDDERLNTGKSISLELLKAIEKSRFVIIICSKNYASSSWCLDELAKIYRVKEGKGLTILPQVILLSLLN